MPLQTVNTGLSHGDLCLFLLLLHYPIASTLSWIRGVNIYSLIIGPIAAAFYVPALIGGLFGSSVIYESSYYYIGALFTAANTIIAAYKLTMCILMIVVTSNSIKKTA